MNEPTKLYSVVSDGNGDYWKHGRRWWCRLDRRFDDPTAQRIDWNMLRFQYGPLGVSAETERLEAWLRDRK